MQINYNALFDCSVCMAFYAFCARLSRPASASQLICSSLFNDFAMESEEDDRSATPRQIFVPAILRVSLAVKC